MDGQNISTSAGDVSKHPLVPLPWSFATPDGVKATLLYILEGEAVGKIDEMPSFGVYLIIAKQSLLLAHTIFNNLTSSPRI